MSDEYGDPMGFALDPLDPLERGVALELVVALDPVVHFRVTFAVTGKTNQTPIAESSRKTFFLTPVICM